MTIQIDNVTNEIDVVSASTNASMTVMPKGTGAINLAPGSSGVNISNGMTVTALTRTAGGSGYTSSPSISISAPTTAGGVQATATSAIQFISVTIASGGTGYTNGDVLTIVGGTFTTVGQMTVTGVSGGVITSVTGTVNGVYSVAPTNPVSVTGGTGSGATFNLSFGIISTFTITNAGSGYVEQPTVTFSGGGGSGAAAYATVGSVPVIRSLAGTPANAAIDFYTPQSIIGSVPAVRIRDGYTNSDSYPSLRSGPNYAEVLAQGNANAILYLGGSGSGSVRFTTAGTSFVEQFRVSHTTSAVNYVQVTGAATGSGPTISAQGSDANARLNLVSKGGSAITLQTRGGGTQRTALFVYDNGTASVNYLEIQSNISGSAPSIVSAGSDTNVDLNLTTKGTGAVKLNTGGGEQLRVSNTASAVNYVQVTGSSTTNAPVVFAAGSDTNIPLNIDSKGTGNVAIRVGALSTVRAITAGASSDTFLDVKRQQAYVDLIAESFTATNADIRFVPKGTGLVQFGTHTATALTISGYIEIKDAGGTIRKLAVVT